MTGETNSVVAPRARLDAKPRANVGMRVNSSVTPTRAQVRWLVRGLEQPGGKLPLFQDDGSEFSSRTIDSCVKQGWAEPWFVNPVKPDWLVCRLTDRGREIAAGHPS